MPHENKPQFDAPRDGGFREGGPFDSGDEETQSLPTQSLADDDEAFGDEDDAWEPVSSARDGFDPTSIKLISLPAVALFSMAIFCGGVLMPPSWYETILGERNHLFLSFRTICFTLACAGTYFLGYRWINARNAGFVPPPESDDVSDWSIQFTDYAMLSALTILHFVSLALLFKGGGFAMFKTWISGDASYGDFAQQHGGEQGGVNVLSMLHLSAFYLAWPFWLFLKRKDALFFRLCFVVFLMTFVLAGLPLGKRSFLLRPAVTMFVTYMLHLFYLRELRLGRVLKYGVGVAVFGFILFIVGAYFRKGSDTAEELTWELTRYLVNPYNQQAMLLDGSMTFTGSGTGYSWTQWFWEFPVFSELFDLETKRFQWLGPRPPYGVTERIMELGDFGVRSATCLSAFGNSYVDFGWWSPLPFLFAGVIAGFLWSAFLRGRRVGFLYYPMAFYAILEWRANLLFPPPYLGFGLIVGAGWLVLWAVESVLFSSHSRSGQGAFDDPPSESEEFDDHVLETTGERVS